MQYFEKDFIQIGQRVIVSDPAYSPNMWCQGVVQNMKPGAYKVYGEVIDCGDWGNRVSRIWIIHEDYINADINALLNYKFEEFEVGVDSGNAGIYDFEYYQNLYAGNTRPNDWYDRIPEVTYNNPTGQYFGTLDEKCIIASAGYGDGTYTCQTGRNDADECVYVEVDFAVE